MRGLLADFDKVLSTLNPAPAGEAAPDEDGWATTASGLRYRVRQP
jgi:hypothetical protein